FVGIWSHDDGGDEVEPWTWLDRTGHMRVWKIVAKPNGRPIFVLDADMGSAGPDRAWPTDPPIEDDVSFWDGSEWSVVPALVKEHSFSKPQPVGDSDDGIPF
ncbi:MAG: hypothetical protein AAFX50_19235, partial [Acidobacteriota bacterium]